MIGEPIKYAVTFVKRVHVDPDCDDCWENLIDCSCKAGE